MRSPAGPWPTLPLPHRPPDHPRLCSDRYRRWFADRHGHCHRCRIGPVHNEGSADDENDENTTATITLQGSSAVTPDQGCHAGGATTYRTAGNDGWPASLEFTGDKRASGPSIRGSSAVYRYAALGARTVIYACGSDYDTSATRTGMIVDTPPTFGWDVYPTCVPCRDVTDGLGQPAPQTAHAPARTATARPSPPCGRRTTKPTRQPVSAAPNGRPSPSDAAVIRRAGSRRHARAVFARMFPHPAGWPSRTRLLWQR